MRPALLSARSILVNAHEHLEGGGVLIREGRIEAVAGNRGEVRRLARARDATELDLGEVTITPGLVDAHAHLELGALRGKIPGNRGFVSWIGALLREKEALDEHDFDAGVLEGGRRLRETGTTAVGDIDSTGATTALASRLPLRTRVYHEVLDAGDRSRTVAALQSIARDTPGDPRVLGGIAPHAPHTTSSELLAACARIARERGLGRSVHWAETPEEARYLESGDGPFAPLLGPSPRLGGLRLLEEAGLLELPLSLVHANHPGPGDLELVASRGATLVHCPGTHAYFDRDPAPIEAWIAQGVEIALGTDSLASNDDLDLRREMALVRRAFPGLSPDRVFDWATRGGARALGLAGEVGELRPGACADLAVFSIQGEGREALLEEITAGIPPVVSTWLAGETL